MIDGFDASFTISVPRSAAWAALEKGRDEKGWWLPAFESRVEELSCEAGEHLRVRKLDEPCSGTEIMVTLEDDGTGTRVTVVQSGFGDWLDQLRGVFAIGWARIIADFALYLEYGARGRRHFMPWSDPGADLHATPAGLVIDAVAADGWAADHGLQPGDVLLAIGGAPITSRGDLETALLAVPAGVSVPAIYVHDGELRTSVDYSIGDAGGV